MDEECTYVVLILMATDAREVQRSLDAPLWLVQRRLHSWESRPEGPAAPFTLRVAERMALWSRDSNITGWGSCGSSALSDCACESVGVTQKTRAHIITSVLQHG